MISSIDLDKLEKYCLKIRQGYSKVDAYAEVYFNFKKGTLEDVSNFSDYNQITIAQNAYLLSKRPEYKAMMKKIEDEVFSEKKKKNNAINENVFIYDCEHDEESLGKEYTKEEATRDLRRVIEGCKKDIAVIDEGFEFEQNNLTVQLESLIAKGSLTKEEQKQLFVLNKTLAKSLKSNKRNEKYYEIIGNTVEKLCKIYNIAVDDEKDKTVQVVFKDLELSE